MYIEILVIFLCVQYLQFLPIHINKYIHVFIYIYMHTYKYIYIYMAQNVPNLYSPDTRAPLKGS